MRFIFLFSITFIVFWVPLGLFISFYKTTRRKSNTNFKGYTMSLLGLITTIFYIYILICPLIVLWGNTNPSKRSCCCTQEIKVNQIVDREGSGISPSGCSPGRGTTTLGKLLTATNPIPAQRATALNKKNVTFQFQITRIWKEFALW